MFTFDEKCTYRMPVHFGGELGSGLHNLQYDDVATISLSYRTDKDKLAQYIPDAFELVEPIVQIGYQKCCGVQWMGGGHYTLISVMAPARHISTDTRGDYVLVIWENKTAPILGGREETGMPKIFADIPDYHQLGNQLTANASHEGRVFLELALNVESALTDKELSAMSNNRINQLGWRYIPNIGRPGAALSHAVIYPVDANYLAGNAGTGKVCWSKVNPLFNPAQARIINALADLPILGYEACMFAKSVNNLRGDLAHEL